MLLGTALEMRNEAEQSKKEDQWSKRRSNLCETEALVELRLFPLFQPAGKFLLHTLSKIILVINLMALESLAPLASPRRCFCCCGSPRWP